jgi:hypothetical protein
MSSHESDDEIYDHHRQVGHELQAACDAVLAADLGQDKDAIWARLRDELAARGHWPQPRMWVEAVVEEIQTGRHYKVVGN